LNKFKEVTRDEYLLFIRNWPNKLVFDFAGMCEPPMGSHNDFTDGKVWPESMVAKEMRDWMGANGETDLSIPGKFWCYYILRSTEVEV